MLKYLTCGYAADIKYEVPCNVNRKSAPVISRAERQFFLHYLGSNVCLFVCLYFRTNENQKYLFVGFFFINLEFRKSVILKGEASSGTYSSRLACCAV